MHSAHTPLPRGIQSEIARALNVKPSAVSRTLRGQSTSARIAAAVAEWRRIERRAASLQAARNVWRRRYASQPAAA